MSEGFWTVSEGGAKRARPSAARRAAFEREHLELRVFNVGDGEAILLVFPGRRAWLIDGGSGSGPARNERLGRELAAYLRQRGLVLHALVPSHPHRDHAGALAPLLRARPALASGLMYFYSGEPVWRPRAWIADLNRTLSRLRVPKTSLHEAHREILRDGMAAHLFSGSGEGEYTSVFVQVRFGEARLLFTGDSTCRYERRLLDRHPDDFRSHVLKVTHHGSSHGTSRRLVEAVRPGIAVASTADDDGHLLELDTLARLRDRGRRPLVLETLVYGDIILSTDGKNYGDGVLFRAEFEKPGSFAGALGAATLAARDVNTLRRANGSSPGPGCL